VATEGLLVLAKTAAFSARFNQLLRDGSAAGEQQSQGIEKWYRVLRCVATAALAAPLCSGLCPQPRGVPPEPHLVNPA
jgi:hypothetical protein